MSEIAEEINKKIKEGVVNMADNLAKQEAKEIIKTVIKTVLRIEESKWATKGYNMTQEDMREVMASINADTSIRAINREAVEKEDYAWYSEEITPIIQNIIEGVISDKIVNEHETPHDLTPEVLLNHLRSGVVRLVFVKKGKPLRDDDNQVVTDSNGRVLFDGGEKRVMWATRNSKLVSLYDEGLRTKGTKPRFNDDDRSAVERELRGDFFTVLDLEKEEFRAFKPSTLMDYDVEENVGSWIVFEEDNDAWYTVIHENDTIQDFYKVGQYVVDDRVESSDRQRREAEYTQEAVKHGVILSTADKEWIAQNNQNFLEGEKKYFSILNGTYQDADISKAYKGLEDFARNLKNEIGPKLEAEGLENLYHSKRLSVRRKGGHAVNSSIEVVVGDAQIILSPYFIVNMKTGKVYLDRYDMFPKPPIYRGTTDPEILTMSDRVVGDLIEQLIRELDLKNLPKPTKRKRVLSEIDHRRMKRLEYLYENRNEAGIKELLTDIGVRIGHIESRGLYKISVIGASEVYAVNSRTIEWVNPMTKKPERLAHTNRHTSALTELGTGIDAAARSFRDNQSVLKGLTKIKRLILGNVFNLRIRNENLVAQIREDMVSN